jgi:hypothetical protein
MTEFRKCIYTESSLPKKNNFTVITKQQSTANLYKRWAIKRVSNSVSNNSLDHMQSAIMK